MISEAAIDLIIAEECTDRAYYTAHETHFEWPKGASGPTVGIGYDCGYVTEAELRADWSGIVPPATVDALVRAIGKRGSSAEAWVAEHGRSVTIYWDQAITQFKTREIPKWEARLDTALPNARRLSPDCRGALLSLVYNRGCSFALDGARYAEMRAIKAHMVAGDYAAIPAEFRSMARLWTGGIAARRHREAALFEAGLAALQADVTDVSTLGAPRAIIFPPSNEGSVDTTTPPPSPPPSRPPAVAVAAKSPTCWSLIVAACGVVWNAISTTFASLPQVQTDTDAMLDPAKALLHAVQADAPQILTALTIAAICLAFSRHVDLKQLWLAHSSAGQAVTPDTTTPAA